MPKISPNRMRVRSPRKGAGAGDDDHAERQHADEQQADGRIGGELERWVMRVTPPIMTAAPDGAPTMPGKPRIRARAIPGSTPWARASPMKARPRRTINVPATAQAIADQHPGDQRLEHEGVRERRN